MITAKDILTKYKVGNMPTLNRDPYPGLDKWWVQVWDLKADTVFCRAYGDSPEEARKNASDIASALALQDRRDNLLAIGSDGGKGDE